MVAAQGSNKYSGSALPALCACTRPGIAHTGAQSHAQQGQQGAAQLVQLGGLAAAAQADGALQRDGAVLPAGQ